MSILTLNRQMFQRKYPFVAEGCERFRNQACSVQPSLLCCAFPWDFAKFEIEGHIVEKFSRTYCLSPLCSQSWFTSYCYFTQEFEIKTIRNLQHAEQVLWRDVAHGWQADTLGSERRTLTLKKSNLQRTKVEPKTYFANERTFIQWMSAAILIATFSSAIMTINDTARIAGTLFVPVAFFFMFYALGELIPVVTCIIPSRFPIKEQNYLLGCQ